MEISIQRNASSPLCGGRSKCQRRRWSERISLDDAGVAASPPQPRRPANCAPPGCAPLGCDAGRDNPRRWTEAILYRTFSLVVLSALACQSPASYKITTAVVQGKGIRSAVPDFARREFSRWLSTELARRGQTWKTAASKAGVAPKTVYNWACGIAMPAPNAPNWIQFKEAQHIDARDLALMIVTEQRSDNSPPKRQASQRS